MPKYEVEITETNTCHVTVIADNYHIAQEKAISHAYKNYEALKFFHVELQATDCNKIED
jgi:hypothetical protein